MQGKEQKHSRYGQIIWEPVHTQKYSMFLLPQKSKNPLGLLKPSLSNSWISVLDLGHDRLQALIQRAEHSFQLATESELCDKAHNMRQG